MHLLILFVKGFSTSFVGLLETREAWSVCGSVCSHWGGPDAGWQTNREPCAPSCFLGQGRRAPAWPEDVQGHEHQGRTESKERFLADSTHWVSIAFIQGQKVIPKAGNQAVGPATTGTFTPVPHDVPFSQRGPLSPARATPG